MGKLVHTGLVWLVVSRSTCPPIFPSPHANSFITGTTVINARSDDFPELTVINTHSLMIFLNFPGDEEATRDTK
jgi:hypothetical protein